MDQTLVAQYTALTNKKPHHLWTEETLKTKIEEAKTNKAPEINLGESDLVIKGNQADKLDDDNPFKNYEFENKVIVPIGRANRREVRAGDYFHVGIIPAVYDTMSQSRRPLNVGKNQQQPYRLVLSPIDWQNSKPIFEKSTNMIFHLLHTPNFGK